jgi:hypothetical protein
LVNLTSLEALQAGVPPPLAEAAQKSETEQATPPQPPPSNGFSPLNWPMLPDVPLVPVPPLPLETTAPHAQTLADFPSRGERNPAATSTPRPPRVLPVAAPDSDADSAVADSPRRRSWPWSLAAAVALLALSAQLLYAFRSETAAHFPRLKPAWAQVCAWAECRVPVLQRPSVFDIQASELLIRDTDKPNWVQLVVTLQNQSSLDVGYPALDLALNDRFNHVVARRVLVPRDYLRGDVRDAVLAGWVVTTIRVNLDLSGLAAGGFGLLLIPAPDNT